MWNLKIENVKDISIYLNNNLIESKTSSFTFIVKKTKKHENKNTQESQSDLQIRSFSIGSTSDFNGIRSPLSHMGTIIFYSEANHHFCANLSLSMFCKIVWWINSRNDFEWTGINLLNVSLLKKMLFFFFTWISNSYVDVSKFTSWMEH